MAWLLDSDMAATSIHRLSETGVVPDKGSIKPWLPAAARENRVGWLTGWQMAPDLVTFPTRSPAGRWCMAWKETCHCGDGGEFPMTCRMCKAVTNPRRHCWLDSLIWLAVAEGASAACSGALGCCCATPSGPMAASNGGLRTAVRLRWDGLRWG